MSRFQKKMWCNKVKITFSCCAELLPEIWLLLCSVGYYRLSRISGLSFPPCTSAFFCTESSLCDLCSLAFTVITSGLRTQRTPHCVTEKHLELLHSNTKLLLEITQASEHTQLSQSVTVSTQHPQSTKLSGEIHTHTHLAFMVHYCKQRRILSWASWKVQTELSQ